MQHVQCVAADLEKLLPPVAVKAVVKALTACRACAQTNNAGNSATICSKFEKNEFSLLLKKKNANYFLNNY